MLRFAGETENAAEKVAKDLNSAEAKEKLEKVNPTDLAKLQADHRIGIAAADATETHNTVLDAANKEFQHKLKDGGKPEDALKLVNDKFKPLNLTEFSLSKGKDRLVFGVDQETAATRSVKRGAEKAIKTGDRTSSAHGALDHVEALRGRRPSRTEKVSESGPRVEGLKKIKAFFDKWKTREDTEKVIGSTYGEPKESDGDQTNYAVGMGNVYGRGFYIQFSYFQGEWHASKDITKSGWQTKVGADTQFDTSGATDADNKAYGEEVNKLVQELLGGNLSASVDTSTKPVHEQLNRPEVEKVVDVPATIEQLDQEVKTLRTEGDVRKPLIGLLLEYRRQLVAEKERRKTVAPEDLPKPPPPPEKKAEAPAPSLASLQGETDFETKFIITSFKLGSFYEQFDIQKAIKAADTELAALNKAPADVRESYRGRIERVTNLASDMRLVSRGRRVKDCSDRSLAATKAKESSSPANGQWPAILAECENAYKAESSALYQFITPEWGDSPYLKLSAASDNASIAVSSIFGGKAGNEAENAASFRERMTLVERATADIRELQKSLPPPPPPEKPATVPPGEPKPYDVDAPGAKIAELQGRISGFEGSGDTANAELFKGYVRLLSAEQGKRGAFVEKNAALIKDAVKVTLISDLLRAEYPAGTDMTELKNVIANRGSPDMKIDETTNSFTLAVPAAFWADPDMAGLVIRAFKDFVPPKPFTPKPAEPPPAPTDVVVPPRLPEPGAPPETPPVAPPPAPPATIDAPPQASDTDYKVQTIRDKIADYSASRITQADVKAALYSIELEASATPGGSDRLGELQKMRVEMEGVAKLVRAGALMQRTDRLEQNLGRAGDKADQVAQELEKSAKEEFVYLQECEDKVGSFLGKSKAMRLSELRNMLSGDPNALQRRTAGTKYLDELLAKGTVKFDKKEDAYVWKSTIGRNVLFAFKKPGSEGRSGEWQCKKSNLEWGDLSRITREKEELQTIKNKLQGFNENKF